MPRFLAATLVIVAAVQTAASAQTINHYVAVPAVVPAKTRIVTRGTPWFVRGASVVAPKAPEKDAKVCAMVAAKIGLLTAFSAGGRVFPEADLSTCNADAIHAVAGAPPSAQTALR